MSRRLPNYLLSYRKRTGLSQHEVAFLLGCERGTMVSRYEHARRRPGLEGVLAYEMVLGAPASVLFAGTCVEVKRSIIQRAQMLARKISRAAHDRSAARKLAVLNRIASGPARAPAT